MKIQSNMYINNHNMTSRNIEKKENGSHALVQEDDIQISDSARKLVETARNKVSDFHTMHFSSIDGEIREIPAEYKCENLFKLDLKATSILGEQSAFEGCSENQSEVFEKWLDENASEYLTEDEMKDLKEKEYMNLGTKTDYKSAVVGLWKNEGSTGLGLAIADSICRLQHLNIKYYFEQNEHCFEISQS